MCYSYEGPLVTIPMSAKNWAFTINNPTVEDNGNLDYLAVELNRTSLQCNYVVYQPEIGTQGTRHYQGYIQFTARKTLNQLRAILGPRCHVEVARGSPQSNKIYCTKEESREPGYAFTEFGQMRGGQGKRNDIEEFVNSVKSQLPSPTELLEQFGAITAKYPRFVKRVIEHYSQPTFVTPALVPRPGWQLELRDYLESDPDPRHVTWYYDPVGNSGKSTFGRHYSIGGNPVRPRAYLVTGGRYSDIFFGYGNERVVFFDWARDNQETFPYLVVENFKNGYFLNTKYEVACKYFEPTHVIIFANFEPDQSKLSQDRWIIKHI